VSFPHLSFYVHYVLSVLGRRSGIIRLCPVFAAAGKHIQIPPRPQLSFRHTNQTIGLFLSVSHTRPHFHFCLLHLCFFVSFIIVCWNTIVLPDQVGKDITEEVCDARRNFFLLTVSIDRLFPSCFSYPQRRKEVYQRQIDRTSKEWCFSREGKKIEPGRE
jgi:hypothetical protein